MDTATKSSATSVAAAGIDSLSLRSAATGGHLTFDLGTVIDASGGKQMG
jgi:hypothetical protein